MKLRKGTFFTSTVPLFLAWDCLVLTIKSLSLKHPITMRDCNERTYEVAIQEDVRTLKETAELAIQ